MLLAASAGEHGVDLTKTHTLSTISSKGPATAAYDNSAEVQNDKPAGDNKDRSGVMQND